MSKSRNGHPTITSKALR